MVRTGAHRRAVLVGSSTSDVNRIGDKTFICRDRAFSCSGHALPLSLPATIVASLAVAWPAAAAMPLSRWLSIGALSASVARALRRRGAIHPSATLESEHHRHQLQASMAGSDRCHPAGTCHGAGGCSFDAAGTAPTHRPRRPHVLQADRSRPSTWGRKPPGAAPDRPRNDGQAQGDRVSMPRI